MCATMAKEAGNTVDFKLLDKLDMFCGSHPHFHRHEHGFQVRHYAGDVNYTVTGFVEKNKDAIGADLAAVLSQSADPMLQELLSVDPGPFSLPVTFCSVDNCCCCVIVAFLGLTAVAEFPSRFLPSSVADESPAAN